MCTWHLKDFETTFAFHASAISSAFRKPNDTVPFARVWVDNKLQKHFDALKEAAAKELVNTTFDPTAEKTQVWFDWSKQAISAVLMQDNKIVRVAGRSCNQSEQNYFPTKGEFLALTHSQMKFRRELLCVESFDAITDHRPLIGLDKKLDLDGMDPMFVVWRERTEQFRSRRNMVHVHGDAMLADLWSRMFPWKIVNREMDCSAVLATTSSSDFVVEEPDRPEIETIKSHGMRVETVDDRVRVWIRKQWRDYVPVRTRLALLKQIHGTKHVGERAMIIALSPFHFPRKKQFIKEFLRNCRCTQAKSDGNPNYETPESKSRRRIVAENPFDIVQLDVYDYKGVHYLTAVDVHTNKAFVQKISRIGQFKKGSMGYTTAVFTAYMIMESRFTKIPKEIRCDNELALVRIPHPKVIAGPIHHPQSQAKVERLHKELSKLCKIHDCLPDVAVNHYNAREPSGGGVLILADPLGNSVLDLADWKDYDGRTLKVGDLVWKKAPPRSRDKSDPFWHDLSRVTERIGAKTYHVYNGRRINLCHIDNLKSFSLGEDLIREAVINPTFVAQAESECFGNLERFDTVCLNFAPFDPVAHDGDTVWIGYPGRAQMITVAEFLLEREFKVAFLIVPELQCERWYAIIDDIDDAKWFGAKPGDDLKFWVDRDHRDTIEPAIVWWLIKFVGA